MLLAEEAAKTTNFDPFDIFLIAFTVLIFIGFLRLLRAPSKNIFALGFTAVSLLVFLFMDFLMVKHWMGLLS